MSYGFLDRMARASAARARAAKAREPLGALIRRARGRPAPPPLRLSPDGFDLIAEVKWRSPSAGPLAEIPPEDRRAAAAERARRYASAGAAAVSVLTEPEAFGGGLDQLAAAAAAAGVPVMRKDFLVDPYQVWEARAAGAGGVLLIARLLEGALLGEMLEAAREAGLFALVECFDPDELDRVRGSAEAVRFPPAPASPAAKAGPDGGPERPFRSLAGPAPRPETTPDAGERAEADLGRPGGAIPRAGGPVPRIVPRRSRSRGNPRRADPEDNSRLPERFAGLFPLWGINARDLATLRCRGGVFEAAIARFPAGAVRVAESAIGSAADAARVARLGYDAALVGTALMRAPDPERLIEEMLAAGRAARRNRGCTSG
ncbi:MAG: hypothetical protein D6718_00020 [Acidobacteria bacterium]|nr:MAG: hypothetical protein D6718_00020 [Acidobacteriota bacterium]